MELALVVAELLQQWLLGFTVALPSTRHAVVVGTVPQGLGVVF